MKAKYILFYILIIFCFSCEKKQDDFTIDKKASFSAVIDGKNISIIESDSLINIDTYVNWSSSRARIGGSRDYIIDIWGLELGPLLMRMNPIKNYISVNFINHFEDSKYEDNAKISKSLFEEVLSKGEKKYSSNYKDFSGILIEWYDSNGVKWTTNEIFLSGTVISSKIDYSGDYFRINQSLFQDDLSDSSSFFQYLDLSFGCRLYNTVGQNILLKNGKFKCKYKFYNRINK